MASLINVSFNPKPSTCMHIDLNSCFATIEQQANPFLRGKPTAVAAYNSPGGCILAASIEAKRLGISTGMRVKDGKMICPGLIVVSPDPWKYRNIHLQLKQLLSTYTDQIVPKSIDEFILNLEGYPAFSKGMHQLACEIKQRIKTEIGEWLTVSIGIAPNYYLAKIAAGLHKPDGLDEINRLNFKSIYQSLELSELCGIKTQNATRLHSVGIYSVLDFFNADVTTLKTAFHSITGYYWYLRLRGWEIDDVQFDRKSFGNSYALPTPLQTSEEVAPLIMKLVQKMTTRLRKHGYHCQGIHYSVLFRDGTHWHTGKKTTSMLFATTEIYRQIFKLVTQCPYQKPIHTIAVSCFNLSPSDSLQLDMFSPTLKSEKLYKAVDAINSKWGDYVITPARMIGTEENVPDRVPFGGIKELEELIKS